MSTEMDCAPEPFVECRISLTSLTELGRGRTADVFVWDAGEVLKLFHTGQDAGSVRREVLATRRAQSVGVRVPAAKALVQVDGRLGVVYERVVGQSMLAVLLGNFTRMPRLARQMGALHAAIHSASGEGLVSLTDYVARSISRATGLDDAQRTIMLDRLAAMPAGQAMCHGDFHPDNILLSDDGPVVIDWMTGVSGNPMADVARTSLLLCGGVPIDDPGWLKRTVTNLVRQELYRQYLRGYRRVRPAPQAEIDAWRPIMAAARLNEGLPEPEKAYLRSIVASSMA